MKKTLGILAVAILALCFLLTIADQVAKQTAEDEQIVPCPWQKAKVAATGTSGDKIKPEQKATEPCPGEVAAKTPEAALGAEGEEIKTPAEILQDLGRPAMGYDAAGPQPGDQESLAAAAKPGMVLADELAVRNRALDEARSGLLARNRQIERQQKRIHALEERIAGLMQDRERQRAYIAKLKRKERDLKSSKEAVLDTLTQVERDLWHLQEMCGVQHTHPMELPPAQDADPSSSCQEGDSCCECDKEQQKPASAPADADQEETGTPTQPGPQSSEPDEDQQQDTSTLDADPSEPSEPEDEPQAETGCPGAIETPSHPM